MSIQLINQEYVNTLKQECDELMKLCFILNNSPAFQKKTSSAHSDNMSAVLVKAEHILLQDFINLYHRCQQVDVKNNNLKAKFTLAYYYESFKKGATPQPSSIEKINTIIHIF